MEYEGPGKCWDKVTVLLLRVTRAVGAMRKTGFPLWDFLVLEVWCIHLKHAGGEGDRSGGALGCRLFWVHHVIKNQKQVCKVVNVHRPNLQEVKGAYHAFKTSRGKKKTNKQTERMLVISTESWNIHRSLPLLITWYLRYLLSAIKTAAARWR